MADVSPALLYCLPAVLRLRDTFGFLKGFFRPLLVAIFDGVPKLTKEFRVSFLVDSSGDVFFQMESVENKDRLRNYPKGRPNPPGSVATDENFFNGL